MSGGCRHAGLHGHCSALRCCRLCAWLGLGARALGRSTVVKEISKDRTEGCQLYRPAATTLKLAMEGAATV